tara:strand:+ start:1305 stop:1802 length:498 start_codon:yes stop_codon:yes gene_type:complete
LGHKKTKIAEKQLKYLHLKFDLYKPLMARITVEDCIDKFPSRFELVLVASNRARKLYAGENPTVEIDNDKNTVIALREIADETISTEKLKNDLVEEYQTNTFDEDEDLNELEDKVEVNEVEEDNVIINKLEQTHNSENQDTISEQTVSQEVESDTSSDDNKSEEL